MSNLPQEILPVEILPLEIMAGGPSIYLYDIKALRCRRCPVIPGHVRLVIRTRDGEHSITPYLDEEMAVSLWHRVRLAWKARAAHIELEYVTEDELEDEVADGIVAACDVGAGVV